MGEGTRGEIRLLLNRSHEDLEAAKLLVNGRISRAALSRAYYAMFYAVTARLLTHGVRRQRHSGVRAAFHQYFVRPQRIESEYGRMYDRALKDRESSDYDLLFTPASQRAFMRLSDAKRLVARIESYLREEGFLEDSDEQR